MHTHFIIFSKDRACQAELLIRSMNHMIDLSTSNVTVFMKASSPDFYRGYEKTKAKFSSVRFVDEADQPSLKRALLDILMSSTLPYAGFLVDDDWIVRPLKKTDREFVAFESNPTVATLSLRLHPKISFCQPLQMENTPQRVNSQGIFPWTTPTHTLEARIRKLLGFRERGGGDWWVKMSMDGNIFRKAALLKCLESIPENTNVGGLEPAMGLVQIAEPNGVCYKSARLINIPLNRVDISDYNYPNMGGVVSEINERYLQGEIIERYHIPDSNIFRSCHVELQPIWANEKSA